MKWISKMIKKTNHQLHKSKIELCTEKQQIFMGFWFRTWLTILKIVTENFSLTNCYTFMTIKSAQPWNMGDRFGWKSHDISLDASLIFVFDNRLRDSGRLKLWRRISVIFPQFNVQNLQYFDYWLVCSLAYYKTQNRY